MLIVIHLSSQTSWAHRLLCTSVRSLKKQGAHNWTRPEHASCAEKGLSSVGSTKNPTAAFLLPSLSCSSEALRRHITKQRGGKTRCASFPFLSVLTHHWAEAKGCWMECRHHEKPKKTGLCQASLLCKNTYKRMHKLSAICDPVCLAMCFYLPLELALHCIKMKVKYMITTF